MRINNLKDLAVHLCVEPTVESIARRLYKDTETGICFLAFEPRVRDYMPRGGIVVSGYCEGRDAECAELALEYPFFSEMFDIYVRDADNDGIDLWNEMVANSD